MGVKQEKSVQLGAFLHQRTLRLFSRMQGDLKQEVIQLLR